MKASIEFEGKEYVMTDKPPSRVTQSGDVVLIGKGEVRGTVAKLARYMAQFGPDDPKYAQRKAKHNAFVALLRQGDALNNQEA